MNRLLDCFTHVTLALGAMCTLSLHAQEGSRYDRVRLENETMLTVPADKAEPVWSFLKARFKNGFTLDNMHFQTVESIETFKDVYYDTPEKTLLKQWGGLRHRSRIGERGEFKELIQMKLTPKFEENKEDQVRNELKFELEQSDTSIRTEEDTNELLHLVKRGQRSKLKRRLEDLNIDPMRVKRFLVLTQERRRIYFRQGDKQFFTITLDITESRKLWLRAVFSQLEVEIGENAFTGADDVLRERFSTMQRALFQEIDAAFPGLTQDQAPKVVKVYSMMTSQGRLSKFLVDYGEGVVVLFVLMLALVILLSISPISRVLKQRR